MPNIRRELRPDGICLLWFDRAHSPANVFDPDTLRELDEHVRAIAADRATIGVVILSAKEKVFHAGADLHTPAGLKEDELLRFIELGQEVFNRLEALRVPKVAAIHGACVGGGYEMALACDYRVASPDHATRIGLPEVTLGLVPAWGGSTRLPRVAGMPCALDVILGGKMLPAKQALRCGLIDEIAPREHLLAAACRAIRRNVPRRRAWLRWPPLNGLIGRVMTPFVRRQVMQRTRGNYPAALRAIQIVTASPWSSLAASLRREREAELELACSEVCRHLISIFFLQEHAKKPAPGEAKPMARAAVIGAGVMGAGIAQWLSAHGLRVLLRDVDPARVAAGMARIRKLFGERRVFSEIEARDGMDRISPVATDVPLGGVDIVIEAAVEKMALKTQLFARLDEQTQGRDIILATNTSALSIAQIANATQDPGRVVGIHFFNPVHKMQLVEIVAAPQTRPEIVQRAVRFAQQIGKLPVVVKDSPGFLVNRILLPYLIEAGLLFEAGARVADVDEAMLDFGMPMGPLRLIDEVGVDIAADVAATLAEKFSDRLRVPELLAKLIADGALGRKSGRGFYVHARGGKTTANEATNRFRSGNAAAELSRADLQRRLALLLVNEAARCVEEGIASGPADVDFAMVMGTGFAPFRGGPLRFAESSGLNNVVNDLTRLAATRPQYAPCELLRRLAAKGKGFYET
ncbi:MAG: enoyl-CoA hydratase/isomerase family protein [Verrucomicrobia bacterium]|nr:enoyl-CoA hydratase/isomerase family protein [Verrucomicrobiota bacterium]